MQIKVQFSKSKERLETAFAKTEVAFDAKFADYQQVTILKGIDPYTGAYEITPQPVQQTIETAGKYLEQDMIIHPIPKEYGRVTYDQSKTITVQ